MNNFIASVDIDHELSLSNLTHRMSSLTLSDIDNSSSSRSGLSTPRFGSPTWSFSDLESTGSHSDSDENDNRDYSGSNVSDEGEDTNHGRESSENENNDEFRSWCSDSDEPTEARVGETTQLTELQQTLAQGLLHTLALSGEGRESALSALGAVDEANTYPVVVKVATDGLLQILANGPEAADSCACHSDINGFEHEIALTRLLGVAFAGVSNRLAPGVYAGTCIGKCTHSIGLTPWRLWMMLGTCQVTEGGSMPDIPDKYDEQVAEMHLRQWYGERRICLIAVAGLEENKWAPTLSDPGCRACRLRRTVLDLTPNAWGASDAELEAANHASVHGAFMDVLSAGEDFTITSMCNACWLFACKRSMMRPGMMPTAGTVMEALASMVPPAVRQVRPQSISFAEAAKQLEEHCESVRFFDLKERRLVKLSTLMCINRQSAYEWFEHNTYESVFISHTWGRYWCKESDRHFELDVPHVCNKASGDQHIVITNVFAMLRSAAEMKRRYVWLDWLCVDQDKASPQKALMVGLQAALLTVVQLMVVYAHKPETITSFQLLRDGVTRESFDADFDRILVDPWFTSLWTLQELALHKKFMGVLSSEGYAIREFDLRAAAKELVAKGSVSFKHAHWVSNTKLLHSGLSVCIENTSSVFACAASHREYKYDDRRAAYSAGIFRLPGYKHDDRVKDSAGVLASGWITELISAEGAFLYRQLKTGRYVRSTGAHTLLYRVHSWHTWLAGISDERVCVLGRTCGGILMVPDKNRLQLRAFQGTHGWFIPEDNNDTALAAWELCFDPVLFLADIGGSKDEADGTTMLCLLLKDLNGRHVHRWIAAIVTVWGVPPGRVEYFEFG